NIEALSRGGEVTESAISEATKSDATSPLRIIKSYRNGSRHHQLLFWSRCQSKSHKNDSCLRPLLDGDKRIGALLHHRKDQRFYGARYT
ncbi:hypothetical protein PoMZ_04038, partial [Pyricularia oryzae]